MGPLWRRQEEERWTGHTRPWCFRAHCIRREGLLRLHHCTNLSARLSAFLIADGWLQASFVHVTRHPVIIIGTSSCVDGTLTVAACNANVCTRPSTAGYVYTSENAANCLVSTGTAATCSASLTCATGYTGTPVATLCTSAGAYSVTGCTEVTTTTTTAPASTTTTAAPASTATTASPAAKAAVDAGVQVTPNKL